MVPEGVLQNMNPAWASCYGDIRGVYDPPIALTQVASVDVPQMTMVPASVSSEGTGATPASSPSKPATETGGAEVLPDTLTSGGVAHGGTPQASSQLARPNQDHSSADDPAVLPDNLPTNGVGGNAPQAAHPSGSSEDVGNIVAAILGGSASSTDDESSSDHSSEAGAPKAHPDVASSSNIVGKVAPHGSQVSGSVQDVDGLVAAILGGAENEISKEASSASASRESSNEVAAGYPSSSGGTAGDNEQQASRLSALDQDVGDVVADVLGGDSGRLPGTGASVSRAPQGVSGSGWDSPATSTFESDDSSHEAPDTMLGIGQPDQTPTAQGPEGQAFVTSHSSPNFSGEHGSGASLGLISDVPTTTSDNESGVNEPISTQRSSADAKASADSSDSTADSSSTGTALFASDRWITFGILMIVIILSVLVL